MSTRDLPKLKILMLHGYTQSGPRFHDKTRALEKAIVKAFPSSTLHYPTGPIPLRPADIPGYSVSSAIDGTEEEMDSFAWWRRAEGGSEYRGMEQGLVRIAETIQSNGPFDGVIGFSQGGAGAAIVASLLEVGRKDVVTAARSENPTKFAYPKSFIKEDGSTIQPPLSFAIVYSGFAAPPELYSGFYEPKIKTPVLHFLGSLDTLVDEKRSRILIDSCEGAHKRVVIHPGGHFLPSQKVWLDATVRFIRECVTGGKQNRYMQEDNVEDMDVPF